MNDSFIIFWIIVGIKIIIFKAYTVIIYGSNCTNWVILLAAESDLSRSTNSAYLFSKKCWFYILSCFLFLYSTTILSMKSSLSWNLLLLMFLSLTCWRTFFFVSGNSFEKYLRTMGEVYFDFWGRNSKNYLVLNAWSSFVSWFVILCSFITKPIS